MDPRRTDFYTDGKVTRRVNRKDDPKQVPSAYQMVYFSCSAGEWGGNVMENQVPAYVYFDYCRCYQESDQDAIYTVKGNGMKVSASGVWESSEYNKGSGSQILKIIVSM